MQSIGKFHFAKYASTQYYFLQKAHNITFRRRTLESDAELIIVVVVDSAAVGLTVSCVDDVGGW